MPDISVLLMIVIKIKKDYYLILILYPIFWYFHFINYFHKLRNKFQEPFL